MKLRVTPDAAVILQRGRQPSPQDEVIARFVSADDANLMVSSFNAYRLYIYLKGAQPSRPT